jgi:gliding motility-associated-like protein
VEDDGKIMLQWNPYDGWQDQIIQYEIWRKIDSDTVFSFVKGTDLQTMDLMDAYKGFRHAIKIKAVALNDTLYSWSNQTEVAFEHAIVIPNIFTPSGDKLNETFTFEHIELYPENELVVYNRYSEEVYRQRNYTGDWNGENLSSGIYYYYLQIFSSEKNPSYKGWIQIMR